MDVTETMGLIFFVFLIPIIVEAFAFARPHEWCTRIGLRTARFRGNLPKQGQVDLDALQDLGFYVRPISDRRILLRPFTVNEIRVQEGKFTRPKGSVVEHIAVLTLGETHWTLEVRKVWLIWAFLLTLSGYGAVVLPPVGTWGVLIISGLFLVLVTFAISSYRSAHKDYRKDVELLEWDT